MSEVDLRGVVAALGQQTIEFRKTMLESEKRAQVSHDELMKLTKANLVTQMRIAAELTRSMDKSLNAWRNRAFSVAERRGLWDKGTWDGFAHMQSEVIELEREMREATTLRERCELRCNEDGKPVGIAAELADVVLSALSMAGHLGVDIEVACRAVLAWHEDKTDNE